MSKYKVTITNREPIPPMSPVVLTKEPTNQHDNEAIKVMWGGRDMGYVSAFYKTRKPGTISAGRLYDKIPDQIVAIVVADGIAEVDTGTEQLELSL